MPYYLVTGARSDTGQEVKLIEFCSSPNAATEVAYRKNVYVASVESLDFESDRRSDDGLPSALLRLATRMKKAKRFDVAIIAARQALQELTEPNSPPPLDVSLRIARYLIDSGHNDEAWKWLGELELALTQHIGSCEVLPHSFGEIQRHRVKLTRPPQSRVHEATSRACYEINHVFAGHTKVEPASSVVSEAIRFANPDEPNADGLAQSIFIGVPVIDRDRELTDEEFESMSRAAARGEPTGRVPLRPFLLATLKAQQVIWDAGSRARDWH